MIKGFVNTRPENMSEIESKWFDVKGRIPVWDKETTLSVVTVIVREQKIEDVEKFWMNSYGTMPSLPYFIVKASNIPGDVYGEYYWVTGLVASEPASALVNQACLETTIPLEVEDYISAPSSWRMHRAYQISPTAKSIKTLKPLLDSFDEGKVLSEIIFHSMLDAEKITSDTGVANRVNSTLKKIHDSMKTQVGL